MIDRVENGEAERLAKTVISGGYCIGCGVCAALPGPFEMKMNGFGQYQAVLLPNSPLKHSGPALLQVCPFYESGEDENLIARRCFPGGAYDTRIGYSSGTYVGFVREKGYRERGSSGGSVSWMLGELLRQGLITGVLHVRQGPAGGNSEPLFKYALSTTLEEIQSGAKSRYYPVELSEVLNVVRGRPGRYALVGLPCFIKAVRLLAQVDPYIRGCVKFFVGVVCGHLKSSQFANSLGWQVGIPPGEVEYIEFRHKRRFGKASRYGVMLSRRGCSEAIIRPIHKFFGTVWGYGFFKYNACDYCDDVFAETADVTAGDAWMPPYNWDSRGTNIVIVRHQLFKEIVEEGMRGKRLHFREISPSRIAQSQEAGLQHRRSGLAYRLFLKDKKGVWRPRKRVEAESDHIDERRKMIYENRILLAEQSHQAFADALMGGEFDLFRKRMTPLVLNYEHVYGMKPFTNRA